MQHQQPPQLLVRNKAVQGSEQARKETTISNYTNGAAILDVIRTSLGPKAKTKMLIIPTGSIIFTTDGNAICRDLHPDHVAAKIVVDGSRVQEEEVGDGTTSVVAYTSSLLSQLIPIVNAPGMHPTFLIRSLKFAQTYVMDLLNKLATEVDVQSSDEALTKIIHTTIGTKQSEKMNNLISKISLEALRIVTGGNFSPNQNIDIKNNIRLEKLEGQSPEETRLIHGIVIEKDVLHSKMRKSVTNPRLLCLNDGLEYKKGESQTTIELGSREACSEFLASEESELNEKLQKIIDLKPDVVLCEKGISEMASYKLTMNNIVAFRRVKKTDLSRLCLASGAKMVCLSDDLNESHIGTRCGLYELRKHGVFFYAYFEKCTDARACTIQVRGPVINMIDELIRNFHDALFVARSLIMCPRIVPGAGSIELQLSHHISQGLSEVALTNHQKVLQATTKVLETIPITLLENAGVSDIARTMLKMKVQMKNDSGVSYGIDGYTGEIVKSSQLNVWDTMAVKSQCIKTAFETAILLTSIDEIVAVAAKQKAAPMEP